MIGALIAAGIYGPTSPGVVVTPTEPEQDTRLPRPSAPRPTQGRKFDEVTIEVDGRAFAGWTDVRVSASIEQAARVFDVGATLDPRITRTVQGIVSQPVELRLGDDLVVTGYVNIVDGSFDARITSARIAGRSRTQDLVDCSADWPGSTMSAVSIKELAERLARPNGITVLSNVEPKNLVRLPTLAVPRGTRCWALIEEAARYSAVLVHDDADGNLVIDRVGTGVSAGAIAQGVNVLAARVHRDDSALYKRIEAWALAYDAVQARDFSVGAPVATETVIDYPRDRLLRIVAEPQTGWLQLLQQRATWEVNRRIGRACVISVVVSTWRDAAGKLWSPNTLVDVSLPGLGINDVRWLIGEVTYSRNAQSGTTAELTIMHPGAFQPQPGAIRVPVPDATQVLQKRP